MVMAPTHRLSPERERALATVRRIVLDGLEGYAARVYLFGSCATGEVRHASDIDVAVEPLEEIPRIVLSNIREALEESSVPYEVDVVDMRDADPGMTARIRREGVAWKG